MSGRGQREVWVYPGNVRCIVPLPGERYYRITFRDQIGTRRETTAVTAADAESKSEELSRAATSGASKATGTVGQMLDAYEAELVSHLNPCHADAARWALGWARRYPKLLRTSCGTLTKGAFAQLFRDAEDQLAYSSRGSLRRGLLHAVNWGKDEDWLPHGRDPLRGVKLGERPQTESGESDLVRRDDEVPSHEAVHEFAKAVASVTGRWWMELFILTAAYSGLRWGELVSLTSDRVIWKDDDHAHPCTLRVIEKTVESSAGMHVGPPKQNQNRWAFWAHTTPLGVDLEGMMRRRVAEVGPGARLFQAPSGGRMRRSNYGMRVMAPARKLAPLWQPDWTMHSLRDVYCTWLVDDLGLPPGTAIIFSGHSDSKTFFERYFGTRPTGAELQAIEALRRAHHRTDYED